MNSSDVPSGITHDDAMNEKNVKIGGYWNFQTQVEPLCKNCLGYKWIYMSSKTVF